MFITYWNIMLLLFYLQDNIFLLSIFMKLFWLKIRILDVAQDLEILCEAQTHVKLLFWKYSILEEIQVILWPYKTILLLILQDCELILRFTIIVKKKTCILINKYFKILTSSQYLCILLPNQFYINVCNTIIIK